jgi:hypothetical protein
MADEAAVIARLANDNVSAIELYRANFATPDDVPSMRFWIQSELDRIQRSVASTEEVLKVIARLLVEIDLISIEDGQDAVDSIISDATINLYTTWSSHKINQELAAIRSDLLALQNFIADNLVAAGYGEISLAADTPMADLGAGWETVPFDTTSISTPKGVTYNLANNSLSLNANSVWQANINVTLTFTEVNAGRVMGVRLFNVTQGTGSLGTESFVGRNTAGHTLTYSLLLETTTAGDEIQIQVSGLTDTFANVTAIGAGFGVNNVGPFGVISLGA